MKTRLLLLLLFATALAFGQNQKKIDTLLSRLSRTTLDSVKAKIYLDLGYEWSDVDPKKAGDYLNNAQAIFEKNKNNRGLCDVFFNRAIVYEYEQKRDSSLLFFKKGIDLGTKINYNDFLGRAYVGLGWSYNNAHEYPAAQEAYLKAFDIAEKTGNTIAQGDALRKMANLYIQMGENDKGFLFYKKSFAKYEAANDSATMAQLLGSIGFAYRSAGNYDSAIVYLNKAIAGFKQLNYLTMIPVAYTEMGMAYLQWKRYADAEANFRMAIEYHKKSNYQGHQDALYINLGKALTEQTKYAEANTSLEKGLAIAKETQDLEMQRDAYEGLFLLYEKQGNYKLAYQFKTLHDNAKDSLDILEQKNQLREITTKYDFEKQQRRIDKDAFKIKQQSWVVYGLIGAFILLSLLAFSYYRRFKLKKEKQLAEEVMHQQDLATKAILVAEENERKRIAAELHDGVGQMMSAAKMNLSAFENDMNDGDEIKKLKFEKIVALVDDSCKEVRAVSHQMMPNALLKNGLANAIRDFVDKIDHRILKVDLYSEGLNERIDSNVETILYRIIQEAVNNVIKHSGANHLDISLIRETQQISVTIEDNGKGFDTSEKDKFEGIGLKNIITRVTYLKGDIEFDSQPGKGTLVAIHVPLQS